MKFQRCSIPPAILFLAASLLFIVLFSMLAPVLFPIDLGQTNLLNRLLPPSFMPGGQPQFLLGTDHLGRDFAIRLVYATRNTLLISFSGMLIASLIGTTLGVIGGLYRGWADTMVMFLIDARLSVPFIVIAIVCSSIFGSDKVMMVLIIGFAGWASFARLIRGQIIQLREANFIECSRAIGASRLRILFEHILRNISSPLIVHATMRLSSFILLESTLSFLGLGILPPDASLGVMVSAGRDYMISAWWLTMIPSAVIVVIVLQVSLIGDWLRDRLDPKLRNNT
ncbi:MAG: ABC transporter permease [Oscillospiraceae bacterium]|nr:ABC transporter permease [Oscillospiraceae bacterium]MCI6026598.1 ABC transporter permease [Oscillospiraceae bacterium]MDY3219017.1 ABC transporter permease [Candidatus Fimivivens sp.]SFJ60635.1 peptide/nickel transport system permease protein [Ruminococcaceae bacterium D5]